VQLPKGLLPAAVGVYNLRNYCGAQGQSLHFPAVVLSTYSRAHGRFLQTIADFVTTIQPSLPLLFRELPITFPPGRCPIIVRCKEVEKGPARAVFQDVSPVISSHCFTLLEAESRNLPIPYLVHVKPADVTSET
jgi:hypothetical protein